MKVWRRGKGESREARDGVGRGKTDESDLVCALKNLVLKLGGKAWYTKVETVVLIK